MRILLVNDFGYPVGGAERYFFSLAGALRDRGHQVVTLSSDSTRHGAEFKTDYQVAHTGHFFDTDSVFSPVVFWQFKQLAAAIAPELIHFHNIFYTLSPSALFASGKIPAVMTLHDYAAICAGDKRLIDGGVCEQAFGACGARGCLRGQTAAKQRIARRVFRGGLRRMRNLFAPSEFVRKEFERNGLTGTTTLRHPAEIALPGSGSTESSPGSFVYVGRLAPQKGLLVLLQAFQLLRSKHSGATLTIVGGGPQHAQLRQEAEKLELGTSVVFTGNIPPEQVPAQLRCATALVLPSIWPEVAGLSMYEAASFGVPAIGSDIGGIPEFIADGVNGLLFRPGDAASLAQKMSWLLEHPAKRQEMSNQSRAMLEAYAWPNHLAELERHYLTACAAAR